MKSRVSECKIFFCFFHIFRVKNWNTFHLRNGYTCSSLENRRKLGAGEASVPRSCCMVTMRIWDVVNSTGIVIRGMALVTTMSCSDLPYHGLTCEGKFHWCLPPAPFFQWTLNWGKCLKIEKCKRRNVNCRKMKSILAFFQNKDSFLEKLQTRKLFQLLVYFSYPFLLFCGWKWGWKKWMVVGEKCIITKRNGWSEKWNKRWPKTCCNW